MTKNIVDLVPGATLALYRAEVTLYVDAWVRAPDLDLEWQEVNFPPAPRNQIPQGPGVYVFVIEKKLFGFPLYGLLAYVGKATNLYNRIGAYISEVGKKAEDTDRPKIWRLLNQWEGYIKYYFTLTEDVEMAEQLEGQMLEAIRPPFNTSYPSTVSRLERMF
jgi:excinuclease UvrABC nuclease subunit